MSGQGLSTEFVALETIEDVTVKSNKNIATGHLQDVVGQHNAGADLMAIIWDNLHFVRWVTAIGPDEARQCIIDYDASNQTRRFFIDKDEPARSHERIGRRKFGLIPVADAVQLRSEGTDKDSVIFWRTPQPDEVPYERFVAYFPNTGWNVPTAITDMIQSTIVPEVLPANLERTMEAFHQMYVKYVDLIVREYDC